VDNVRVGQMARKRWGRIDPEEQGAVGLIVEVTPARAWTFITVNFPFGCRTYRMSEIEIITNN